MCVAGVTYIFATLLGVVQGLTEFLPVSSSAHLILARAFFGWDTDAFGLPFDVACHVGTLAAVLYYFRGDLGPMLVSTPQALLGGGGRPGQVVRLVILGTVPAVVVGLLASDLVETRLRTPAVCAVTLAVGALLMMWAERVSTGQRGEHDLTVFDALAIGCAQAAALVPGVSRAGATITLALLLGVRREAGARFTFLLSIPAILLAAIKTTWDMSGAGTPSADVVLFALGMLSSAVVGYLSIRFFLRYLVRHTLDVFAWYRLALASVVAVWLIQRS